MMIRHVSIPAKAPAHVAQVLAELIGGRAFAFPGEVKGAFMAVSGDALGAMIEVYPDTVMAKPGAGDRPVSEAANPTPPDHWPFHMLLSVDLDEDSVLAIGAREGWRTRRFGRGGPPGTPPLFEVIEFWVENRFMIEVSTQPMAAAYERTCQFAFLEAAGVPSLAGA